MSHLALKRLCQRQPLTKILLKFASAYCQALQLPLDTDPSDTHAHECASAMLMFRSFNARLAMPLDLDFDTLLTTINSLLAEDTHHNIHISHNALTNTLFWHETHLGKNTVHTLEPSKIDHLVMSAYVHTLQSPYH